MTHNLISNVSKHLALTVHSSEIFQPSSNFSTCPHLLQFATAHQLAQQPSPFLIRDMLHSSENRHCNSCLGHKAWPDLKTLHKEERREGQHGKTTIPHLHANRLDADSMHLSAKSVGGESMPPCQAQTKTLSAKPCLLGRQFPHQARQPSRKVHMHFPFIKGVSANCPLMDI